jgi:hypothetical protein
MLAPSAAAGSVRSSVDAGSGACSGKTVNTLAHTEHLTFEPVGLSILSSRLKLVLHALQVIIMTPSLKFQMVNFRQIPVIFCIIQTIPHEKTIFNGRACIVDLDCRFSPFAFVDYGADLNAIWTKAL